MDGTYTFAVKGEQGQADVKELNDSKPRGLGILTDTAEHMVDYSLFQCIVKDSFFSPLPTASLIIWILVFIYQALDLYSYLKGGESSCKQMGQP